MENFELSKQKIEAIPRYIFLDLNGKKIENEALEIVPTIRGTYIISKNDKNRTGKIELYEGKSKYFIKTIKFGYPGEILVDPVNSNVQAAYTNVDNMQKSCEYTAVSQDTFDLYSRYLSTKNPIHFQNVVRRLNNGEA